MSQQTVHLGDPPLGTERRRRRTRHPGLSLAVICPPGTGARARRASRQSRTIILPVFCPRSMARKASTA